MEHVSKLSNFAQEKYIAFTQLCEKLISFSLILLIARFAGAIDFWKSGQTKINGSGIGLDFWNGAEAAYRFKYNVFDIAQKKFYLFEKVYHIPEPFTKPMTQAATIGEFLLPLLLVFGLTSRLAALGLLGMTAFIQFWVFPNELLVPTGNWSTHLLWAAPLLLIVARGPGAFSLDAVLGKMRHSEKTDINAAELQAAE